MLADIFQLTKTEADVVADMYGPGEHAKHYVCPPVLQKTLGESCPAPQQRLNCRFSDQER